MPNTSPRTKKLRMRRGSGSVPRMRLHPLRGRGIKSGIPNHYDQIRHRKRSASLGGRDVTVASETHKGRDSVDRSSAASNKGAPPPPAFAYSHCPTEQASSKSPSSAPPTRRHSLTCSRHDILQRRPVEKADLARRLEEHRNHGCTRVLRRFVDFGPTSMLPGNGSHQVGTANPDGSIFVAHVDPFVD
jgi:hypothetical protein